MKNNKSLITEVAGMDASTLTASERDDTKNETTGTLNLFHNF